MPQPSTHAGFSLIEAVVAVALLATAVVALAGLFGVATRSNLDARSTTYATVLAAQKLEQLRATGVGRGGRLDADVAGWVDYLDPDARVVGGGSTPPASAAYVRRWSSRALPAPLASPGGRVVVQVMVTRRRSQLMALTRRLPDEARLTTVMRAPP